MKIAGIDIDKNSLIIAGAVSVGLGFGYAFLRKLKVKEFQQELYNTSPVSFVQAEDLEVNIYLEHEYGNFRNTISRASASASAFLNELPVVYFKFNENFLNFTIHSAADHFTQFDRALVIGCGTGRFPYSLTKYFCQTCVVDQSRTKISQCFQFQNSSQVQYAFPLEGTYRTSQKTIPSPVPSKKEVASQRRKDKEVIQFYDVDPSDPIAMRKVIFGEFELVVFPNSLNTLQDPDTIFERIHNFVLPGGILVISSDYNWSKTTAYGTGFNDGSIRDSFHWLKKVLDPNFKFLQEKNIPDVVGTSLRSCIIRNCHVTAWKRLPPPPPDT